MRKDLNSYNSLFQQIESRQKFNFKHFYVLFSMIEIACIFGDLIEKMKFKILLFMLKYIACF